MNAKFLCYVALAMALMGMMIAPSYAFVGLKLTKTANVFDANLGDQVIYMFFFENTGNEPLTNLRLIDDHLGVYELDKSSLAVGENYSMSINYTIKQTDVVSGPLSNEAQAQASGPSGLVVSNNASWMVATGYSGYLDANGSEVMIPRPG